MVIFEDLHWIDEETQEFLNLLADSLGPRRFAAGELPSRILTSVEQQDLLHAVAARPAGQGERRRDAGGVARRRQGSAALKRLIIERTEGNPFFMEEIVQALFDEGALQRNGAVKLTKPLNALKIPPTVQGILAARIDRLPADAKELLQTLAVIGREFPLSLIRAVTAKSDDELNRCSTTCNWASSSTSSRRWATPNTSSSTH
jgi:predicted ATPase